MLTNGTDEAIDALDYPLTTDEVVEALGDRELRQDCSETVADALGRICPETYDDAESARLAVCTGISSDAIGRKGYADREPSTGDVRGGYEPVSF